MKGVSHTAENALAAGCRRQQDSFSPGLAPTLHHSPGPAWRGPKASKGSPRPAAGACRSLPEPYCCRMLAVFGGRQARPRRAYSDRSDSAGPGQPAGQRVAISLGLPRAVGMPSATGPRRLVCGGPCKPSSLKSKDHSKVFVFLLIKGFNGAFCNTIFTYIKTCDYIRAGTRTPQFYYTLCLYIFKNLI